MAEWLSSYVKEQPEVREALSDLADNIREYEDAAKPSACIETGGSFWSPELTLFRPGWILFTIVSIGYGIAGIIFSLLVPSYQAGAWADLALRVTVPVFVLGISLVAVSRSLSDSGKFAVEYLNDSCRTLWFCCLTLVTVLCGLVGRFFSTLEWFPNVVTVGLCMVSLGAAIDCLAMLAFVILEKMRCSVPNESIRVASRYAARKLTYGYVNDAYVKLFWSQQKDYLASWCAGKTIYPPSQYYGHYFKSSLYSGNGDNDVEIELDGHILGQHVYKDYDLKVLERCAWRLCFYISISNLYYCLKEDYYVQEIDLFNFFCFGAEHSGHC